MLTLIHSRGLTFIEGRVYAQLSYENILLKAQLGVKRPLEGRP